MHALGEACIRSACSGSTLCLVKEVFITLVFISTATNIEI